MDTLVIDAGNTRIQWRLRRRGGGLEESDASLDDLQDDLESVLGSDPDSLQVAVSCLRKDHRSILESVLQNKCHTPILWIENGASPFVSVRTDFPQQTGADRALSALAWGRLQNQSSAIIIDAGTAVTVDAVTPDGVLLGGWITPGWQALKKSLEAQAPELPVNSMNESVEEPWAQETLRALGGGLETLYGAGVAALQARVEAGFREQGEDSPVTILTGGDAARLRTFFPHARHLPGLVLDGLEAALKMHDSSAGGSE